MALNYGFFNSTAEDVREYNAEDFAKRFSMFFTNGVAEGSLGVTPSGLSVNVDAGLAHIDGYHVESDTTLNLEVESNSSGYTRIDRVVVRLDLGARIFDVYIKEGTPSSSPVAPDLQRDSNVYELSLSRVTINNNATSVSVADERGNREVCGYIKVDTDVPTSEMWEQFDRDWVDIQDTWREWFENRQDDISPTFYYTETEPTGAVEGDIWNEILI